MLGGVHIQTNDIFNLFGKARIIRDLKGADQMRFQPVLAPNAPDGAGAHVHGLGH